MNKLIVTAVATAALCAAGTANATIATVFNDIANGTAAFNSTVVAAGGTASAEQVQFNQSVYTDFTLSKAPTNSYGSLTGYSIDISPSGSGSNPSNYAGSGFTIQFNTAVNAIGFEVGDWGTCCQPSALFISFDDGAPIQVGLSTTYGDVFFNGTAEVFVGAFDDSGDFSKVTFWGNGVGEYLVAGGTFRYALLDQGSLPGGVPEPASWAMMIGGLAIVGASMRRRKTVVSFA